MSKKSLIALAAALFLFSNCAISQKTDEASEKSPCTATIDQPKQGENVGPDGQVSGHATNPPGTFTWVLARKRDINGFWPQANGPVPIGPDSTFRAFVTYGKEGDKGPFEVTIAIVDDAVNQALNRWVDHANETGKYPPVRFPNVHQGCAIAQVVVSRQ